VVRTLEALARVRGMSLGRAAEATTANAYRLFGLTAPELITVAPPLVEPGA